MRTFLPILAKYTHFHKTLQHFHFEELCHIYEYKYYSISSIFISGVKKAEPNMDVANTKERQFHSLLYGIYSI